MRVRIASGLCTYAGAWPVAYSIDGEDDGQEHGVSADQVCLCKVFSSRSVQMITQATHPGRKRPPPRPYTTHQTPVMVQMHQILPAGHIHIMSTFTPA